jgi:hypothetical protein
MCVVTSIWPGLTLARGCCPAPTDRPPKDSPAGWKETPRARGQQPRAAGPLASLSLLCRRKDTPRAHARSHKSRLQQARGSAYEACYTRSKKQPRLLSSPGLIRLPGWGSARKPRNNQNPCPYQKNQTLLEAPSLARISHAHGNSERASSNRAETTSWAVAAGGPSRTRLTAISSPTGLGTPCSRQHHTPRLTQNAQPVRQTPTSPATSPRP